MKKEFSAWLPLCLPLACQLFFGSNEMEILEKKYNGVKLSVATLKKIK